MPKPVLVVGIGGTGQWVLTWLKRDLLEIHGHIPPQIQLLAFDTTTTVEASTSQAVEEDNQAQPRIGDIVLEPHLEFIHLGGDAYDFAREIRDGRFPHIQQWFQAKFWLSKLNPSAFILEEGAGRIRPLGRLALFRDMIQNGGVNIINPLRTKLLKVYNTVKDQPGQKITIVVTASFAGGTGSGLFLDITLLLHMLARKHDLDYSMVGFFVLPWAFTPHPNDQMLARTFAAWRELNRFMVLREDFPMPEILYDPDSPDLRYRPERRLFETVYLVDGRLRDGGFMGEEAAYTTHPAIASAIYTLYIDEHASPTYVEKVVTNLHEIYAQNPGNPMYSTFGLKQLKIPAHFLQEQATLFLGRAILEHLLAPAQPTSLFHVLIEDSDWLQNIAAIDRNQEDPGVAGRERAPQIFAHSVQFGNLVGKTTRFLNRLGQLLERSQEERQKIIEGLARAGMGRNPMGGWLAYFPDLGDDPKYQKLREQIEAHVRFDVRKSYGRRKGEKGHTVRRRLRDLPEEVRRRFGITTLQEGRGEDSEYHGEFGEILHQIRIAQVDIFRHLLRLHILRILNGSDPDPLKARSGKLGYAWDFLNGVVDALRRLLALLDDAWKYREEKVRPEIRIAERLARAERKLKATAGKTLCFFLPFIEHPDVRRAEEFYLRAWQERIDARREDILHRTVRATVQDMLNVATIARDRIRHWILHLSTGDPSSGVYGMWRQMQERQRLLEEVYNHDLRLNKIQLLLEDEEALQRLQAEENLIRDILQRISWDVTEDLKIQQVLAPRLEGEQPIRLPDPFLEKEIKWREETSQNNFQQFYSYVTPYTPQIVEESRVADRIKRTFGRGTQALREFIQKYELNQISVIADVQGKAPKDSTLIAVQTQANDPFFYGPEGLEGELRNYLKLDRERIQDEHPVMAADFENPYKFVTLHTEELHAVEHYQAWKECQKAYQQHMRQEHHELNPVHLHIFNAEALAAELERRLVLEKGLAYRPLSPRVVLLLENKPRLMLFFWMWALGHIYDSPKDELPYRWEFSLPENAHPTIWLTRGWDPHTSDPSRQVRPTIIEAAHGFVVHGETYEPGRSWRIRYPDVERWLREYWRQRGLEARVDFIRAQLDPHNPDSLIARMEQLIRATDNEVLKNEYESLKYVFQLLFEDEERWLTS